MKILIIGRNTKSGDLTYGTQDENRLLVPMNFKKIGQVIIEDDSVIKTIKEVFKIINEENLSEFEKSVIDMINSTKTVSLLKALPDNIVASAECMQDILAYVPDEHKEALTRILECIPADKIREATKSSDLYSNMKALKGSNTKPTQFPLSDFSKMYKGEISMGEVAMKRAINRFNALLDDSIEAAEEEE